LRQRREVDDGEWQKEFGIVPASDSASKTEFTLSKFSDPWARNLRHDARNGWLGPSAYVQTDRQKGRQFLIKPLGGGRINGLRWPLAVDGLLDVASEGEPRPLHPFERLCRLQVRADMNEQFIQIVIVGMERTPYLGNPGELAPSLR
jgi:hypothetical protein